MQIKQLSVFIENKKGRLAEITRVLGENKIDIRAISVADTSDFGILRIIVDRPEEAMQTLKNAGMTVALSDVIVVCVSDTPGAFADVVEVLSSEDISIEYVYAFMSRDKGKAFVIVRADNGQRAAEVLSAKGIGIATQSQIQEL